MAIYTIYANQVEEVQKRLDHLAKKAASYSIPFSYTISEEHPQVVAVRDVDQVNQIIYTVNTYTVAAVDVSVECDGFIKANGWTVRAKAEHGDKGNIVTGYGDKPVPAAWYTAHAHCDHCKTNRFRSITFFCENEAGEIRQVGRTCLKDYTGISPATAAMWAEVCDIFPDDMSCTVSEWAGHRSQQMYAVELVLAHACDVIKEYGYRKKDEPGCTRDAVTERVLNGDTPTVESMEKAQLIREWLASLEQVVRDEDDALHAAWQKAEETDEDCDKRAAWKLERKRTGGAERKGIVLALSGFAKTSHFGLLAYLTLVYERYLERKAREEQWEAERVTAVAASDFVGAVGQRITIPTATAKLVTSWDGYYGTTFLYRFTDEQGNVFVWKSSKCIDMQDGMTVKGSIKEHSEYNGVKQTVITRCAVA